MIVIMKSRILLFLGLLSCIGLQMFAQVSVSGKVVDAGGIEMPGVNIAIKGTMVGTMTGADGTVEFNLREGTYPVKITKKDHITVNDTVVVAKTAVTKNVALIKNQ